MVRMTLLFGLALLTLVSLETSTLQAAWNSSFQTTYLFRRNKPTTTTSNYAPVVAGLAVGTPITPCNTCNTQYVQRSYYEPVTSYERKTYYEPVVATQTSYYYEPVTTYRYSCFYDPCSCSQKQVATPETSYQLRTALKPVTTYVEKVGYQPMTGYRQAFYYEPVTTCTQTTTTTTVGSPILAPSLPPYLGAPAFVPQAPCATPTPALSPPGVNEQRLAPSPTGAAPASGNGIAPVSGRVTSTDFPRVLLAAPQVVTPPAPAQPVRPTDFSRLTSRGREYTQLNGSVPSANSRVVFIPTSSELFSEETRSNPAGRFNIRLASGTYAVYAENGNGRPVFVQNIEVRGALTTVALAQ